LKTLVRNVEYPLSKNTFSRRLNNLTANLTAYIFGTKLDTGLDKLAINALTTRRDLLHCTVSKRHELCFHKRL